MNIKLNSYATAGTKYVWSYCIKIMHHALTILEIETEGQQILIDQGIGYEIKFINTNHDTY